MIIEIRARNFYVFTEEIKLTLAADMRNKKFSSNVYKENGYNILKVAGTYGANNVGKTCLIRAIKSIRNVILGKGDGINKNLFLKDDIVELGVTFLESGTKYSYDLKYDTKKKIYVYEKFAQFSSDKHKNEKEETLLIRNTIESEYQSKDIALNALLPMVSKNGIIINLLDEKSSSVLHHMKQVLVTFAMRIDIVDMNNIPIERTINLLKNEDNLQSKVIDFIKNADLDMDDFGYRGSEQLEIETINSSNSRPEERALAFTDKFMDQIRLVSVYKGVSVPSILFDSTGTKKLVALASYIVEALEQGRILVIDELDSSIHFKLTRAIVAMFNNELNHNAQMIFTVHDINLMDCQKLFRKEQIWFVNKDEEGVYVYSLGDFTANMGVRDTTDVIEKYKKGMLGAIPEPELIKSLIDIRSKED